MIKAVIDLSLPGPDNVLYSIRRTYDFPCLPQIGACLSISSPFGGGQFLNAKVTNICFWERDPDNPKSLLFQTIIIDC